MQRRSIVVLAAVAVVAMGLTACSSAAGPADGTITVAYQRTSAFQQLDDVLVKAKAEYEAANPGRTVALEPIDAETDQYFTKLALMNGSADTAPDVIYEDSFQVRSDAAAGYLAPLDDQLGGWADWAQFDDTAKQAGRGDDGKIYGVSMGTDTRGIFYNKAIFAKAGLPADWKPRTWDDVLAAARAVKAAVPGVAPLQIYAGKAAGEATSMQGVEMLLYGTGDTLYDETTQKWTTGSPGFRAALGFLSTAYGEKLTPGLDIALDAAVTNRTSSDLIPKGKVAMAVDGSWLPGQWISGDNAWPEWQKTMGIAAMPTQNGQAPGRTSMSGGWVLSVGANADDPDAAFGFITTALNRENSFKYDTENSQIAVRKDVATDPAYLSYNASFPFFSSLVADTHFRPTTPDYSQISANIQVAAEAVATGAQTPEQAAAAYDEAVTAIVGQQGTQAAG